MSSTTAAVGHVPTPMPPTKTTPTRDRAGGDPGPFPVTIVRPALVTLPPLTAVQRDRHRAARKLAADLTERALRRRWRPVYHPVDLHLCVDEDGEAIIRDAPGIAAAPLPGAVQVGRDRRGRALAVVLHADGWSLVIDAFAINTYGWQPPMTWVFLDRPDRRQKFRDPYLTVRFYHGSAVAGVAWSDMVADVLALTTERPAPHPAAARPAA